MKKNWMQIATLVLCVLLLFLNISQKKQFDALQERMENRFERLRSNVQDEVKSISSNLAKLEKANQIVTECTLEPNGIDKETHALQAVASVTLKEWYEDTAVTLLANIGGEELSIPLTADGTGVYTGQLSLPLDGNHAIFLHALVTGGGLTQKETLNTWSELSMLLPVQYNGSGWTGPEYADGIMRSQFDINLEGQDRTSVSIQNAEFLTYRNGKLVQTQKAVEDSYSSGAPDRNYIVDTVDNEWSVPCEPGDVIEIRFRCQDEYGLGYDFLFHTWVAEEETVQSRDSDSPALTLYWSE